MKANEAIEILKGIYPGGAYSPHEEQRLEAINMAIAALVNTQECRMVEVLRTEYEKGRYDMREEMMKEAVELTVYNGWEYGKDPDKVPQPTIKYRDKALHIGDKVKLIIVKED